MHACGLLEYEDVEYYSFTHACNFINANGNRQPIYTLGYSCVIPIHPAPSTGNIVGGIVGCILVLVVCFPALVPIVALIVRRKRQKLSTATSENQEAPAGPVYDEITTIKTDIQLESNSLMDRLEQCPG